MDLTLRQARRLERAIDSLKQETLNKVEVSQATISIYRNFDATLKQKQDAITNAVDVAQRLTIIRFAIRKSIETDNEVSGLNTKMNLEASLKDQLKVLESLVSSELTTEEKSISRSRHEAAKSRGALTDEYGRVTDSIAINAILGNDEYETYKTQAKTIKRQILALADEMTSLNTTRVVKVDGPDVAWLEQLGIIV